MQENLSSLLTSAAALTLVVVGLVQGIRSRAGINGGWSVLLLACGVGAVVGVGASLGLPEVSTVVVLRGAMAGFVAGCMAVGGMTALDRLRKPVVNGEPLSTDEPKEGEAVK